MTVERLGAYGIALPGLPGQQWLNPVPKDWPDWRLEVVDDPLAGVVDPGDLWRDDRAIVPDLSGGHSVVDRESGTTRLPTTYLPTEAEWVHPILFPTALVVNDWHQRIGFHAAAFLDERGRAWTVAGDREAGKSTTVAWLAAHGIPVLADDLVITDGATTFVGPRSIDLREPTARQFGMGEDLGESGRRERFRVTLPPVVPTAPYAGMVRLRFGPVTELVTLAGPPKLSTLASARALWVRQRHPLTWLRVVAKPCVEFRRPRDWAQLDAAMASLLEQLAEFPD